MPTALLLVAAAPLVALAVLLVRRNRLRAVPGPPAASFWHGSDALFLDARTGQAFQDQIVREHGMVVRLRRGFWRDDQLFVCDPLALQHMLVKDAQNFEQGLTQQETTRLIHGPGLLSSTGEVHKRQRRLLNPVFAAPHLRKLLPIFYDVSYKLCDDLDKAIEGSANIDVLGHLSRTALELVGRGGLGHSFSADGPYTLSETLKDLLPSVFQYVHWWPLLRPLRAVLGARVLRVAAEQVAARSAPAARLMRNIDALDDATRDIFERKKQAVREGRLLVGEKATESSGPVDIISQLLLANEQAPADERHPDEELRAHMATLITAGRDTVSHVVARTLQVLADRPDVQDELRAELLAASHGGAADVDFDALGALPFLDAVLREVLRLHSTISFVNRTVQHDTVLPRMYGEPVHVPGGTTIRVGLATANTAPALWGADAREFRPARWLAKERACDLPGVWAGIMSFMGGPRACIGYRFALLEMKVLLAVLLRRYRFRPGAQTAWYLGPSNTPYVVGREGEGPQLPLRVELQQLS